MVARAVQLTRYSSETIVQSNYGAYRMRIVVSAVQGADLDKDLFIFKRMPPSPYNDTDVDVFEAVVGPPQLADVPRGEPVADQAWPYFRTSEFTLDVASATQADEIWLEVQREISVLVSALNKLDTLNLTEQVWIPIEGESDNSESQSESESQSQSF